MSRFSMRGNAAMQWDSTQQDAEYDVYIYRAPGNNAREGHEAWEKKRTTGNRLRALAAAKKLHESEKYRRVEIKKKAYDRTRGRAVATTFKVYEGGRAKPEKSNGALAIAGGVCCLCAAAAMLIALLLI